MEFSRKQAFVGIASLFLIASGTATVLSYFATSTGSADVTQAVVFDSQTGTADLTTFDTNEIVAGDTTVDTYDVVNNQDNIITLDYSSDLINNTSGNTLVSDETGNLVDWNDGDDLGVDTTYATYHSAGHDFSNYDTSGVTAQVTVTDSDDLQTKVGNANSGDTILVEPGDYSDVTVSTDGVTLVALNKPTGNNPSKISGSKTGVLVQADGVTIKGFNIKPQNQNDGRNARGIDIQGKNVEATQNYIHEVRSKGRPIGIFVFGNGNNVDNARVVNNLVEDVKATDVTGTQGDSKSEGVKVLQDSTSSGSANNVEIKQNTVKDIGNQTHTAMGNGITVSGGGAEDFVVNYNHIMDVEHNVAHGYTPISAGFYVTGYDDSSEAYGSSHSVNFNNFELTNPETVDVKDWDGDRDNSALDANDNYWGEDGILYAVQDVEYTEDTQNQYIEVSWNLLQQLEAGEETGLAIVNEFDQKLSGSTDYKLITQIK